MGGTEVARIIPKGGFRVGCKESRQIATALSLALWEGGTHVARLTVAIGLFILIINVVFTTTAFAYQIISFSGTTYNLLECPAGNPCNFASGNNPPPAYLNGLTQQAFTSFYANYQPTQAFSWAIEGYNNQGYVFGSVLGGGITAFDTQFVFYQGQILCCTLDQPYRITGEPLAE
jgi:hypothetical protein